MLTPLGPLFAQGRSSGSPTETFFGTVPRRPDRLGTGALILAAGQRLERSETTQGGLMSDVRGLVPLANSVPFTAALGALTKD